jgi:TetR/AcrR family transcriptional repressor of nem operon
MKVSKQRATENRDAIVQVAAAQLRERGFTQMSVADVAEAAGLTHGALYSHFKSKEALQAAAVERAFEDCVAAFAGLTAEQFLSRYLSEQHRDNAGHGCPTAALVSEMPWQSEEARAAFYEGFGRFAAMLKATLQPLEAAGERDLTMLAFAAMTGTLAISRAVQGVDPALANSVLHAVAGQLREVLMARPGRVDRPKRRGVPKKVGNKPADAAAGADAAVPG